MGFDRPCDLVQRKRFFRRKPLSFISRGALEYVPARLENISEFVYAPVIAGFWTHRDLIDGVFTLDDLLDAHEMLEVRHENERRAYEAARQRNN
ncbi:DUF6889 family protein [Paenibacillus sp. GCM10012303]|uniref:DUF6889 family protein n=1 Tax=Paenibacillus sp. GCM10012303 TaxID=3317340 RepID=UPI0036098C6D